MRAWLAFSAILLLSSAAHADDDRAGTLFSEGLEAMDKGRYAEGCPKIAKSQELDPRAGTLFTLAECEWKWGKGATALGYYEAYLASLPSLTAEQRAKQAQREPVARAQVKALEAHVARVTFVLEPSGTKTKLEVDGYPIADEAREMAIAPGEHTLATQGGNGNHTQRFTAKAGERQHIVVDVSPGTAAPSFFERVQSRPDHVPIYVSAGVGVAGIIAGSIFGGLALGSKSTVDAHCGIGGDEHACDPTGRDAVGAGRTQGWVSTVALGVGVIGLATAVTLYLVGDTKERSVASIK